MNFRNEFKFFISRYLERVNDITDAAAIVLFILFSLVILSKRVCSEINHWLTYAIIQHPTGRQHKRHKRHNLVLRFCCREIPASHVSQHEHSSATLMLPPANKHPNFYPLLQPPPTPQAAHQPPLLNTPPSHGPDLRKHYHLTPPAQHKPQFYRSSRPSLVAHPFVPLPTPPQHDRPPTLAPRIKVGRAPKGRSEPQASFGRSVGRPASRSSGPICKASQLAAQHLLLVAQPASYRVVVLQRADAYIQMARQ